MPSEYLDRMARKFNALDNGFSLSTFYAPTYQAYGRVNAELMAGRLNADLLLLADPGPFLDLKARNELLSYDSEVYDHYPAGHFDKDRTWVDGRSIATMIAVHQNVTSVPDSWVDFASAQWKNRIGLLDIRVGGTAYNWYFTLRQKYPVEYFRELAALRPVLQRGQGQLMDQLVTRQIDISEMLCYQAYTSKKDRGAPIIPIYPKDVVPITMAPLAILKKSRNPEAAKAVFDWWLSKDGQEYLQQTNGVYSVRNDVTPLEGKPGYAQLNTIEYDLEEYTRRRAEYRAEYTRVFNL